MSINSYEVVNLRTHWHVAFGADTFGPFRNRAEAISTAKGWASKNTPAVIIVEIEKGEFETVWTSDDWALPLIE